jgi:putative tryptophan/tyrosine transport system substrate-binding protein
VNRPPSPLTMLLSPHTRRREVIAGLASSAVASPLTALAQQSPERVRRVGVLMDLALNDAEAGARLDVFRAELSRLGWTDGRNTRIDIRWGPGIASRMRQFADELVALAPDALFASGSPSVGALQQSTTTLPIVFATVADPVGAGFVASLAQPGRNITGFMLLEYSIGTKWLELLKEVEPRLTRVAVLRDPTLASGSGQFGAIQAVASSFGVEVSPIGMGDAAEIERALDVFARGPKGGLIVTASTLATVHRDLIVGMASKHRLPAIYANRLFVTGGGLLSYISDRIDQVRRAAGYVDRILRGEKAANLPVQAPTKYELVINLKTAKALGLNVPAALLARADAVIE